LHHWRHVDTDPIALDEGDDRESLRDLNRASSVDPFSAVIDD